MTKKKISLRPIIIENYEISGYYYQEKGLSFRKYLNIKHKLRENDLPDLMVIMMNPGSSQPIDENENGRVETKAKPDPTQTQIIRVMEKLNFRYARILNLSDLREPKSTDFYKKINSVNESGIIHSIFHENRVNEFNELYVKGIPVIYAWGINKKLIHLAKCAIKATEAESSFGWRKPKFDFAYYHPLPRSYKKQKEWYEAIESKLNQRNNINHNT